MRAFKSDFTNYHLAVNYLYARDKELVSTAQYLVADILLGLGISKEQVDSVLHRYADAWAGKVKIDDGLVSVNDSVNLISDLYGEQFRAKRGPGSHKKKSHQSQTPQERVKSIRAGKKPLVVNLEKCTGCKLCLPVCTPKAFHNEIHQGITKYSIDLARCTECGDCWENNHSLCPEQAISRK